MRGWAWMFGLTFLVGGSLALNQPPRLGESLPADDHLTSRKVDLGRGMFLVLWNPDLNRPFNERRCINCHDQPVFGGRGKPELDPLFVADPTAPGGFRPVPRRIIRERPTIQELPLPQGVVRRKSPALFGVGLLEAVPDATLMALADPSDADGDGISGRLPKVADGRGRFGWKSTFATLDQFVEDAFKTEIGTVAFDIKSNPLADLDTNQIEAAVWAMRLLAPPPPPPEVPEMERGRALFEKLDCAKCHVPELQTGSAKVRSLSAQRIRAYSDLLLHEMGDDPPHTEPSVPGKREVRTPPLWGLRFDRGPYLHDARAPDLRAAILGHGGEGARSRAAFEGAPAEDQDALIAFLQRL